LSFSISVASVTIVSGCDAGTNFTVSSAAAARRRATESGNR
jgi:hypothetical protein